MTQALPADAAFVSEIDDLLKEIVERATELERSLHAHASLAQVETQSGLDELRARLDELRARLDEHSARIHEARRALHDRVEEARTKWGAFPPDTTLRGLVDRVTAAFPDLDRLTGPNLEAPDLRAALSQAMALRVHLQDEIAQRLVKHRPMNVSRSSFHVASGVGVVLASTFLVAQDTLLAFTAALAAMGWTFELTRRIWPWWNRVLMGAFKYVAHAHETHGINSSTWYVTALATLLATAPLEVANLGVLALAVGDPVAGLVGRRFGRTRLLEKKTLEGSLAFLVAATLAGLVYLTVSTDLGIGNVWLLALVASVAGSVAELLSTRVDDNLSVPLSAGWAALLTSFLLI